MSENSKFETIPNDRNSKYKNMGPLRIFILYNLRHASTVLNFEHSVLNIVSDFGFRISNFGMIRCTLKTVTFMKEPAPGIRKRHRVRIGLHEN